MVANETWINEYIMIPSENSVETALTYMNSLNAL